MAVHRPMTQRMIAEEVGVSVTTVSRVLNERETRPGRWASASTVAAIVAAARRGGYTRNPHAASLRTARSDVVGVLVPRLQDFVLATIYEGVDEAAAEHGISTFVTNSLDDPALQRSRTQRMLDRRVDGLIFGDAHSGDPFLDEFATRGVPFVLTSRRGDGRHVSVTCDDLEGGRLVGRHLLGLGRRDVAVITGHPFASTGTERTQGLLEVFAQAGIRIPAERVAHVGFDVGAGRTAAEALLTRRPHPDALFATNDFAAIGAMGVLRDRGLRVPDDVALVGYNDTPLAAATTISLTTVRSPMHAMGRLALETLLDLINGRAASSMRLAPVLIPRASTGAR